MVRTSTKGIFQSEVVIRTAIMAALWDLRQNPFLLDYAFAFFAQDDLTKAEYGDASIEDAKKWFLNTEIPIGMSFRIDSPQTPLIAITLEDGNEGQTTLGDVNYDPTEDVDVSDTIINPAPIMSFTPAAYYPATGAVILPQNLDTTTLFPGMVVFDTKANKGYVIQEVTGPSSFNILPNSAPNLTKATIAPRSTLYTALLGSVEERESYRIDLYVSGNPKELLYLYSIVKFCLYKYKKELFEARGFERSNFTSTGVRLLTGKPPELIFTRGFIVNGYVRQFWPQTITPKIDGIIGDVQIGTPGGTNSQTPASATAQAQGQGWSMDSDNFDGIGQS